MNKDKLIELLKKYIELIEPRFLIYAINSDVLKGIEFRKLIRQIESENESKLISVQEFEEQKQDFIIKYGLDVEIINGFLESKDHRQELESDLNALLESQKMKVSEFPVDIDKILVEAERTGWVWNKGVWMNYGHKDRTTQELYDYLNAK